MNSLVIYYQDYLQCIQNERSGCIKTSNDQIYHKRSNFLVGRPAEERLKKYWRSLWLPQEQNPEEALRLGGVKRGLDGRKAEESCPTVFLVVATSKLSQLFLLSDVSSSRHLHSLRARAVNILLPFSNHIHIYLLIRLTSVCLWAVKYFLISTPFCQLSSLQVVPSLHLRSPTILLFYFSQLFASGFGISSL